MPKLQEERESVQKWTDLWFTEHKRAGYIVLMSDEFKEQSFFGHRGLDVLKSVTHKQPSQYISLNAFYKDEQGKISRRLEHLRQIRLIGIDIDQYNLGLSPADVKDRIAELVEESNLPAPNLMLTSRGVQLFYAIDKGASPEMAWLAGYITEQFVNKLADVGADMNATDMSRVMRVPESVNERNNSFVKPEILNGRAYTLQELQSYCAPLERNRNIKQSNNVIGMPGRDASLFHRTNWLRQQDLRKLIQLRKGDFTNLRNVFIYIYAYQQTLILNNSSLEQVAKMVKANTSEIHTTDRNSENISNWFDNTVKSAYEDAVKFMDYLKAADYNPVYKRNDGIIKPYKTENLIKKLNITVAEQRELSTLANDDIKQERRLKRQEARRRENGIRPMSEYNKERKTAKEAQIEHIKELKAQGMKQKDIAVKLGISAVHVSRLLKNRSV